MKVSGFTLVRNGVTFDYPFRESVLSLLPLVDELWINVGKGDDQTLQEIGKLAQEHPKINFFESHWPLDDPEQKRGGKILSDQTNLALERCTGDWCVYLQADEVLHEEDAASLRQAMETHLDNPRVEALVLNYLHFYGSYEVVQQTRSAYRREVRVLKRNSGGQSIGDAQSFRKPNGEKLNAALTTAKVFHYGWVRSPQSMKDKTWFMDSLYHGEGGATGDNYLYKRIPGLRAFTQSHPKVMDQRIRDKGWHWDLDQSPRIWKLSDLKKIVLDGFERITGVRLFEYRSYKLIKP